MLVIGSDVNKELNHDDRLQAPRGQPDGAAHDVRLGEGRVVDPIAPELPLQAPRDLEHPPFPFTCSRYCSRLASATSSPYTRMRGSRAISALRQPFRRSTLVVGSPVNWGSSSVSNCSEAGSTSGE